VVSKALEPTYVRLLPVPGGARESLAVLECREEAEAPNCSFRRLTLRSATGTMQRIVPTSGGSPAATWLQLNLLRGNFVELSRDQL
jgi:hypothetical protein